jgi:transitional endoplasmic reticulum ATPase
MNRWVGQSEKIIAKIFDYARTFTRGTLFIDEVDYIAPRTGPSYMMRIKRELLQQMDGVSSKKDGLLVFGATNRPWMLDPAARRPSPDGLRFSKIILVPPPDFEARREIFRLSLSKINNEMISDDVDLNELAEVSHGFSGADSARAKSIIPWVVDALKSVKRYGEEYLASQVAALAKEYLSNETAAPKEA